MTEYERQIHALSDDALKAMYLAEHCAWPAEDDLDTHHLRVATMQAEVHRRGLYTNDSGFARAVDEDNTRMARRCIELLADVELAEGNTDVANGLSAELNMFNLEIETIDRSKR